jgi:hypothetical protein
MASVSGLGLIAMGLISGMRPFNSTGLGTVPLLYSYVSNYNRVPRVLKAYGKNGFKLLATEEGN